MILFTNMFYNGITNFCHRAKGLKTARATSTTPIPDSPPPPYHDAHIAG
jgi:hypothetical protein